MAVKTGPTSCKVIGEPQDDRSSELDAFQQYELYSSKRRHDLSTTDVKRPKKARVNQDHLKDARHCNERGTAAAELAAANRVELSAWHNNTNFLVPEDEVLQDDIAGGQSHRANLQHQMQRQEARLYDNGTSGDVRNMSSNATHLSTSLARARITQRVPESTSKHSSSNAKYTRAQLENIRKSYEATGQQFDVSTFVDRPLDPAVESNNRSTGRRPPKYRAPPIDDARTLYPPSRGGQSNRAGRGLSRAGHQGVSRASVAKRGSVRSKHDSPHPSTSKSTFHVRPPPSSMPSDWAPQNLAQNLVVTNGSVDPSKPCDPAALSSVDDIKKLLGERFGEEKDSSADTEAKGDPTTTSTISSTTDSASRTTTPVNRTKTVDLIALQPEDSTKKPLSESFLSNRLVPQCPEQGSTENCKNPGNTPVIFNDLLDDNDVRPEVEVNNDVQIEPLELAFGKLSIAEGHLNQHKIYSPTITNPPSIARNGISKLLKAPKKPQNLELIDFSDDDAPNPKSTTPAINEQTKSGVDASIRGILATGTAAQAAYLHESSEEHQRALASADSFWEHYARMDKAPEANGTRRPNSNTLKATHTPPTNKISWETGIDHELFRSCYATPSSGPKTTKYPNPF